MRIINLSKRNHIYSCNVYLILGDWNSLDNVNTMIDVGRDPAVLETLQEISTGVGKRRAEQVLITHNHYDHVSLLPRIVEVYRPAVWAGSPFTREITGILKDGQVLKAGDSELIAMHTPGHSNDSFCFYSESARAIFSGDTPLIVQSVDSSYEPAYIEALQRICSLDIEAIYPGHGPAIEHNCKRMLAASLDNVRRGRIP